MDQFLDSWHSYRFRYCSVNNLGLVSFIFDNLIYPKLNARIIEMPKRMEWYIIIVPVVFICSLFLSGILDYISKFVFYCVGRVTSKLKEKREKDK